LGGADEYPVDLSMGDQEIYVGLEELLSQGVLELFLAYKELSGLPAKYLWENGWSSYELPFVQGSFF
jgi:hypothetical protein